MCGGCRPPHAGRAQHTTHVRGEGTARHGKGRSARHPSIPFGLSWENTIAVPTLRSGPAAYLRKHMERTKISADSAYVHLVLILHRRRLCETKAHGQRIAMSTEAIVSLKIGGFLGPYVLCCCLFCWVLRPHRKMTTIQDFLVFACVENEFL